MPLGVMVVGTILKEDHGLTVDIHYLPSDNTDLEEFLAGLHIGPDVGLVGLGTICGTLPRTLTLAKRIKELHPRLPVVLGGPQASSVPGELMAAYEFIDGIVIGEAESVVTFLWEAITTGQRSVRPGLIYIPPGASRLTLLPLQLQPAQLIDADDIRPIDYTLTPPPIDGGARGVSVEIGRGCPYKCTFCSTKVFFQRRFRFRSADMIIAELQKVREQHASSHFEFVHDMFTTNRRLVADLCKRLISEDLHLDWACSARTDRIDDSLLDLMYEAGCRRIFFGVESGSENMQQAIKKGLKVADIKIAVRSAWERQIGVTASLIIGFPAETPDDLADTLNLYFEFRSWRPAMRNVQVHSLSPLAGTELTAEYEDQLQFDGRLNDVAVMWTVTPWEEEQIRRYPRIFSSFYYFPNEYTSRAHYRYIYWFILHLGPFGNTLRLLWDLLGPELGTEFVRWVRHEERGTPSAATQAFDPATGASRVYAELRQFLGHLGLGQERTEVLLQVLEFEHWLGVSVLLDPQTPLLSWLDCTGLDTRPLADLEAARRGHWLYSADTKKKTVRRIRVPQLADAV